jgi:hypothetical protein
MIFFLILYFIWYLQSALLVLPVNGTYTGEITPEAYIKGMNKIFTQWWHFWLCYLLVQEVPGPLPILYFNFYNFGVWWVLWEGILCAIFMSFERYFFPVVFVFYCHNSFIEYTHKRMGKLVLKKMFFLTSQIVLPIIRDTTPALPTSIAGLH